jgi:formate dehydrogenase maturation protein FdhE
MAFGTTVLSKRHMTVTSSLQPSLRALVTSLMVVITAAAFAEVVVSVRSGKAQSLADFIAAICAAPFRSSSLEEAQYLSENVSAMTKMMIDMGIQPSGDVDRDFVAMMTPHHQGAIEMALAELRYGHNEQLRRMAQEIIVTQQQEIAAMRLALGQPLPPSAPSPDQMVPAGQIDSKSIHPTNLVKEP